MKFNELLKKWEEQNRTAESKQLRLSGKVIKLRYQSLESGIIIPFELCITSELFELNVLFSDGYFIGICTTIGKQSKVSWAISAMCLLSLFYESLINNQVYDLSISSKLRKKQENKHGVPIKSLIRRRSSGFLIDSPTVGSLIGQIQTLQCI